jgi:hypothetical protein
MFFVLDSCACGLHPNPAKVPNLQYRAWLYSLDQKFYGDDEKTRESRFWDLVQCPTAIIRPKSQNSNIRHDGIPSIGNFMLMINNHFAWFQLPGKLLKTKKMCSLFPWQHGISYLLLSAYMKYIYKGKYWFQPKNFEFFLLTGKYLRKHPAMPRSGTKINPRFQPNFFGDSLYKFCNSNFERILKILWFWQIVNFQNWKILAFQFFQTSLKPTTLRKQTFLK